MLRARSGCVKKLFTLQYKIVYLILAIILILPGYLLGYIAPQWYMSLLFYNEVVIIILFISFCIGAFIIIMKKCSLKNKKLATAITIIMIFCCINGYTYNFHYCELEPILPSSYME